MKNTLNSKISNWHERMEYKEFKNKHSGEKVIVCGLGRSLLDLKNPQDYTIIGVNDISRQFTPNYLVVLNDKTTFLAERWKWIESTKCETIFTHLKHLAIPDEKKVVLQLGKYGGHDIDKEQIDYTSNSPYVGCIIAAYMGFTKIGILGVDFTKNHFFKETGEHSLARRVPTINKEYMLLHQRMKEKGIELVNLSEQSVLTIPKISLDNF